MTYLSQNIRSSLGGTIRTLIGLCVLTAGCTSHHVVDDVGEPDTSTCATSVATECNGLTLLETDACGRPTGTEYTCNAEHTTSCTAGTCTCQSPWTGLTCDEGRPGICYWSRALGGEHLDSLEGMAVDSNDHILALVNHQDFGFSVYALDSNGEDLWHETIDSSDGVIPFDLTVDKNNNIYVFAQIDRDTTIDGQVYSVGPLIIKLSSTGAYDWIRPIAPGHLLDGGSIEVDSRDNLFIAGTFTSSVNFGGADLNSQGDKDIFLAAFDETGAHSWSQSIGGSSEDGLGDIALGPQSSIYLCGWFYGTTSWDGDTDTDMVSAGDVDIAFADDASE